MQRRSSLLVPALFLLAGGFYVPRCGGAPTPPEPPPSTTSTTTTAPTTTTAATAPTTTTAAPVPSELTSFDATPPDATWQRPGLLTPTTDPVYGTSVRRLTSADGTRFDRNTYSRRQPENSDGTRFMTYHGDAEYRVYDRVTGALEHILAIHPDAEPQWHPTNPAVVRHILGPNSYVGDLKWYETNVENKTTTAIADLTDRIRSELPTADYMKDRAEGSPSSDGTRSAWIVYSNNEQPIGIVSYDLVTDQVLGIHPLGSDDGSELGRLDWVSMTPTGAYVMAGHTNATLVYDSDLSNGRRVNNKADHSDIALDADGRDTYVYIDFSADVDGGWLVAVDLATLVRTRLVDLYDDANTSIHISGKGYDRPGWVVVSTYNCKVPGAWSCDKVMLVDLSGTDLVYDLAHTYNCGDNYWTETHAAVNRAFTRVYFNSDGGSCGIDAEVYELTLPPFSD